MDRFAIPIRAMGFHTDGGALTVLSSRERADSSAGSVLSRVMTHLGAAYRISRNGPPRARIAAFPAPCPKRRRGSLKPSVAARILPPWSTALRLPSRMAVAGLLG